MGPDGQDVRECGLAKARYRMTGLIEIAEHHGLDNQLEQTVEECAELIQAIKKYKRYPANPTVYRNLIEEITDVEVMLEQIIYLLDISKQVDESASLKVHRELGRIEKKLKGLIK